MGFLQNIYNSAKSKLTDNEGWFRGGKFTSLQQLQQAPVRQQQQFPVQQPQFVNNLAPQNQFPVIEPPKPVFKTQAATNLNNRIDILKRIGASPEVKKVQEVTKTPSYFDPVAGQVRARDIVRELPGQTVKTIGGIAKYVGDDIKYTVEHPKEVVDILNKRYVQPPVEFFTKDLPDAANQPYANKLFQQSQDRALEQSKSYLNQAIALQKAGDTKRAKMFYDAAGETAQTAGQDATNRVADIDTSKNKLYKDAVETANSAASVMFPAKTLQTVVLGTGLNSVIEGVSGNKEPGHSLRGLDNTTKYGGFVNITNPIISGVVGKYAPMIDNPKTQALVSRTVNAIGNLIEDRGIDTLYGDKRQVTDDIVSLAVGFLLAGKGDAKDYDSLKKQLTTIGLNDADSNTLANIVEAGKKQLLSTQEGKVLNPFVKPETPKIEAPKEKSTEEIFGAPSTTEPKPNLPKGVQKIDDVLGNVNRFANNQYTVNGTKVDFEKMVSEGWTPSQTDYAVKIANQSSTKIEDVNKYLRGIMKAQYPDQAAKMGGGSKIPVGEDTTDYTKKLGIEEPTKPTTIKETLGGMQEQPTDAQLDALKAKNDAWIDYVNKNGFPVQEGRNRAYLAKELGIKEMPVTVIEPPIKPIADMLKPEVTPKVEAPKVETAPKETTRWDTQMKQKMAEMKAYEAKIAPLDDMLAKEGFDTTPATESKILSGELPASKKLLDLIKEKNSVATANLLELTPDFPKEKLKPNYVPEVNKDKISVPVDETPTGFQGMLRDTTYEPNAKRAGMPDEKMATGTQGGTENKKSYLKKKYFVEDETGRIIKKYNIDEAEHDAVYDFVASEKLKADSIAKERFDNPEFGKIDDFLKEAHDYEDSLRKFTKDDTKREVIGATYKGFKNTIDNLMSSIRGDAIFFKDKTRPEIYDAFIELRKARNPNSGQNYGDALNKFITKLESYDYDDPAVRDKINKYIGDSMKEYKVIEKIWEKSLRATTEVMSLAQIGGNIKTAIQQTTETFRLIPEHGVKNFLHGVTHAFDKIEADRLVAKYNLSQEVSGNIGLKPLFEELKSNKSLPQKSYECLKNILYYGLMKTEGWKNIAYASALENAGKEKGLKGDDLTTFVNKELLRLAHMSDGDLTPSLMKNNAVTSSLLQYSQYALKNLVLKWDTIAIEDKPLADRLTKLTGLFLADFMAIGTMAGVTGVAVDGAKGWLSNSVAPSSFGPLVTVPQQMIKEKIEDSKLTEEEREKQTSLADKEKAILFRNTVPMGNQLTKTGNVYNPVTGDGVLQKGYGESKKGNITYTVGDMNPIQKAQAFFFGAGAIPNKKKSDEMYKNKEAGTSKITPTLTPTQSKALKDLPKDQMEAYYNQKIAGQVSAKDKVQAELNPKKPNFIESILGGKKEETKATTVADILNSTTATASEIKEAKAVIKEKLDSGNLDIASDDDLKAYFFSDVDKMPEGTPSEKQDKLIKRFAKLNSIYESETLEQEAKDRLYKLSGFSDADVEYYKEAGDNATVKAMRQEEKLGTTDRKQWLSDLEDGRKLVGDKQIVENDTLNELYERGLLSDEERDYLIAVKYDPATNKYYLDRDYKDSQGKASAAATKKKLKAYTALQNKLASKKNKSTKNIIADYLKKSPPKSSKKSIGSILASGQFKQKEITLPKPTSSTVKRVKSQYNFK